MEIKANDQLAVSSFHASELLRFSLFLNFTTLNLITFNYLFA